MSIVAKIARRVPLVLLEARAILEANHMWHFRRTIETPQFKQISVCVGIKNRTDFLLNKLIDSLNRCHGKDNIELSVFDCNTDDTDDLKTAIQSRWKGKLVFRSENIPFSRTHTFNEAVKQSTSQYVFICDADMTLPEDFGLEFAMSVDYDNVWFPICFSLYKNKPSEIKRENGWWRREGFGMVGISKKNYLSIGGYDESFKTWGREDNDMFWKCYKMPGWKINRNKARGLFHNWHPTVKDDWRTDISEADIVKSAR